MRKKSQAKKVMNNFSFENTFLKKHKKSKTITIPVGVTNISGHPFQDCLRLKYIYIPKTVKFISTGAFRRQVWMKPNNGSRFGCYYSEDKPIEKITVCEENTEFSSCCGILYNKAKTEIIYVPKAIKKVLTIPNTITKIENCTFDRRSKLVNVNIPNSIISIGEYAFAECKKLKRVNIPTSVQEIHSNAFRNCSKIKSISIPESVTTYWGVAFNYCNKLKNLTVDSNNKIYKSENNCILTKDGFKLIEGCNGSVIPSTVQEIADVALRGCAKLKHIHIPDSVTSIGRGAFEGCSGLTSISAGENNTTYKSVNNCLLTKDGKTLILGCKTSVIPDSVTSIGYEAFRGCRGLTSVTIPDSVTSIGVGAFRDCSGLTSVTIPDSVTSIGVGAFRDCSGLTDITFNGTKAQWIAIEKKENWNSNTSDFTVICTDGKLDKNGNVIE